MGLVMYFKVSFSFVFLKKIHQTHIIGSILKHSCDSGCILKAEKLWVVGKSSEDNKLVYKHQINDGRGNLHAAAKSELRLTRQNLD